MIERFKTLTNAQKGITCLAVALEMVAILLGFMSQTYFWSPFIFAVANVVFVAIGFLVAAIYFFNEYM